MSGTELVDVGSAEIVQERDCMHIVFGLDENYFRGMGVTITSVLVNNPNMQFVFHVFSFAFSDDVMRRLRQLEERYDTEIRLHVVDKQILNEFQKYPSFAAHHPAMLIRLLIPNAMQGIAKRVLYLDGDVLCLGAMAALHDIDIDDVIAAAVADEKETTVKTQVAALNLEHAEYFNAGVIYINVDNWIASNVQARSLTALSEQTLVFADQDALNLAMNGRVRFIDEHWNYRYHLVQFLSMGVRKLNVTVPVVFMHFTGPVKPWHDWCLHEAKDIFVGYQALSSWADVPLDAPRSVRELKLYSKFLLKQERTLEGICWHLKYLWKRALR